MLICSRVSGSPAPAPLLLSPADGSNGVDPDPVLTWRWIDNLVDNGSFETGLSPGWQTRGANPEIWQVSTNTTDAFGMGYCWLSTQIPQASSSIGQVFQDIVIPADAISATLEWKQRLWNQTGTRIGRLRVLLYENGSASKMLDEALGTETIYTSHQWVTRSTNLMAYVGRSLQLVVQAEGFFPPAADSWHADLDGLRWTCEHSTRPDFLIYTGHSPNLGPSDLLGVTNELTFDSVALEPLSQYYWKVASVRDGVTNYSTLASFRTAQRSLPQMRVINVSDLRIQFSFMSRLNRFYTVQQIDSLDGTSTWYDSTIPQPGIGGPMVLSVLPPGDAGFFRLRITP